MFLFTYISVTDSDFINQSVTMSSFQVLSETSLFATREFLISFNDKRYKRYEINEMKSFDNILFSLSTF